MTDRLRSTWQPPDTTVSDLPRTTLGALETIMRDAARRFDRVAIAFSLQAEDMVLLDMAARLDLPFRPFVLDTLRLHAETLAYLDLVSSHYKIDIIRAQPDHVEVARFEAAHGQFAFYDARDERTACCGLRKVQPLGSVLTGFDAWITGQRRAQSETRSALVLEERDPLHAIAKLNPLADWSEDAVWQYLRTYAVPIHPLYSRGFASIGCEPCTRAIRADEPVRAGRWWWEDAASKECGLHVSRTVEPVA
jgi:phosphoadenosine phosphosulfate reductase